MNASPSLTRGRDCGGSLAQSPLPWAMGDVHYADGNRDECRFKMHIMAHGNTEYPIGSFYGPTPEACRANALLALAAVNGRCELVGGLELCLRELKLAVEVIPAGATIAARVIAAVEATLHRAKESNPV